MVKSVKILFVLLCWACVDHVLCSVSPPENVSISCHNFENHVYWNYSDTSSQPEFTVTVVSYKGPQSHVMTTKEKHLSIMDYTNDTDNVYEITVKALLTGSEPSRPVTTKFSYNNNFKTDTECVVDFPNVSVFASEHTIEYSFEHPFDFYDIDVQDDQLDYTVLCNETECGRDYCYSGEMCTKKIPFPEKLNGQCFSLRFTGIISNIPLETSVKVCSPVESSSNADVLIPIIILCMGMVILMVVVAAVMYKKLTQSRSQKEIIQRLLGIQRSSEPSVVEPEQPALSEVRGMSQTSSLVPIDDCLSTTTFTPVEVTHLPINPMAEEHESGGEGEDSGDSTSFSGYDCKKFPLEMSPGDLVEAYRP